MIESTAFATFRFFRAFPLACVALAALLARNGFAAERDLAPRVENFSDDFRQVRLRVEPCWPAASGAKSKGLRPVRLIVGFRAGEPVCVWAHGVSATPAVMHLLRERTARLTADALKGRLTLFFGDGTMREDAAPLPIEFDLKISGRDLSGTIAVGAEKPAQAKGSLASGAELAKENALAAGKDWPGWQGVEASVRGPASGLTLVDELPHARPVWRSEAFVPTAFGNAADFRYALRSAAQGTCGGASSPVVLGGRVFLYYYQASGSVDEKAAAAALAKAAKPLPEFQQAWVRDMFRDAADDVIVAHDAASGRALWRTTLPLRTLNLQTHKHRGVNPTPLAAGGALFVPSYSGRVYCLDAASGAVRWEFPAPAAKPFVGSTGQKGSGEIPVGCASPVLIGGTLGVTIKEELVGIAAENGRQLWKTRVAPSAQLYAWASGGKATFLAVGVENAKQKGESSATIVSLVDAVDGKVIWRAEADFIRDYRLPIIAGDLLIGYRYGKDAANNITDGNANVLVARRLIAGGLESAWELKGLPAVTDSYGLTAHDGFVYLSGDADVWAISLKDGAVAAKIAGTGGARTQVMWTAEDRVFICPEGRHGRCALTMLTARGAGMKLLGTREATFERWQGAWMVENPFTTAYANHQIIHPVVDGRLFVRGGDGIYCYDLRKASARSDGGSGF